MCGRTVVSLGPADIQKACTYKDKQGKQQTPDWKDAPNGKSYSPSYNVAPGSYTPVLLSGQHVNTTPESRVIQPMMWGLIPSWHKGAMKDKAFETNNCRAEGMLEKQTYKQPLQKGRRCVILAEGFYEWKRDKAVKQPYYIYFPKNKSGRNGSTPSEVNGEGHAESKVKVEGHTNSGVKVEGKVEMDLTSMKVKFEKNPEADRTDEKGDINDNTQPQLLTMAGVFDVWNPSDGSGPVYSYSVITVESSPSMSWIHHRMPAILSNEEEVEQWLNFGEYPLEKAVKVIQARTCIQCHPVSTVVNNSRNNTPDCIKPIDPSKPKSTPSSNMMMNWLSKGQGSKMKVKPCGKASADVVKTEPDTDEPPDKKVKVEGH